MRAPLICGFVVDYRCSAHWSNWVTVRRSNARPWLLYDLARSTHSRFGGAVPEASKSRSDSGNQPLRRIGLGQKNCFQREFVWWR